MFRKHPFKYACLELAESIYYVYRATHDPLYLEMGAAMVDSIETTAKTECGYASVLVLYCILVVKSSVHLLSSQ